MKDMVIVSKTKGLIDVRTPQMTFVQAGSQGPQGPAGIQGPQGIQGIQGPVGPMMTTGSTGVVVETAPSTFAARTITGTANRIAVTNGDGVAGNPTINFDVGFMLVTGEIGVMAAPNAVRSISVGAPSSAGTQLQGVDVSATVPSTATTSWASYRSLATTAAAAFTVVDLHHFYALGAPKGAGSTITNARGFAADSTMAVGTNNFGFWSNFAQASNTWQLYMGGTGESYFGGPVGILTNVPQAGGALLYVADGDVHPSTGNTVFGVRSIFVGPTTATTEIVGVGTTLSSSPAAYSVTLISHFKALLSNLGAGSTISNVRGFYASNSIAVGTTNVGFYSDIAAATTTFALLMDGTAESRFDGSVQVNTGGTTQLYMMSVNGVHLNTGPTIYGYQADVTYPATQTGNAYAYRSVMRSTNAVYTTTLFTHFIAESVIKGASHTLTTVRGFSANNGINPGSATNTVGFYSDIAADTTTWQLAMTGTAPSYFNGAVGIIQNDPIAGVLALFAVGSGSVNHPATSTIVRGAVVDYIAPSTATNGVQGYRSVLRTANAVFTTSNLIHFFADNTVKGAASTVTTATGFYASSNIANGATSYGFYSDIADNANQWQLYMNGTAGSFFRGPVGILSSNLATFASLLLIGGAGTHPMTATTVSGVTVDFVTPATATNTNRCYNATIRTPATAATFGDTYMFIAATAVKGAGSSMNNLMGFYAANGIVGLATNTRGFYSDINSAASTWQFYAGGTALNFFRGGVVLDTTAAPTVGAGQVGFGATVATTVGAAGGASALPATPLGYLIANVAGTQVKIPYYAN